MKLYYLATNNLHPPLQPALGGDLQKRLVSMVTMVTMVKLLVFTVAWLLLAGRGGATPATKWAEESEVWGQQLDMVLDNQEVSRYIYISTLYLTAHIYVYIYAYLRVYLRRCWRSWGTPPAARSLARRRRPVSGGGRWRSGATSCAPRAG